MVRELYWQRQDYASAETHNSLGVYIEYEQSGEDILKTFVENDVESLISYLDLFCDNGVSQVSTNVYLNSSVVFPYDVVEGSFPTQEQIESGEPMIVLGKCLKTDTYQKSGIDYYKICGEEYRVAAYVSASNSVGLDAVRLLFYNCLGDKTKEEIDYTASTLGLTLYLESDSRNLTDFYNEKQQLLNDRVRQMFTLDDMENSLFTIDTGLIQYQQYAYLLYLFSIILIIMITEFWIAQRKKEFAIRRAVGYSKWQIIRMLAGELFKLILIASVFLLLAQLIFRQIIPSVYYTEKWIENIGICIIFMIVTFILLMIYPIYKITHDSIVASIQNKGV